MHYDGASCSLEVLIASYGVMPFPFSLARTQDICVSLASLTVHFESLYRPLVTHQNSCVTNKFSRSILNVNGVQYIKLLISLNAL